MASSSKRSRGHAKRKGGRRRRHSYQSSDIENEKQFRRRDCSTTSRNMYGCKSSRYDEHEEIIKKKGRQHGHRSKERGENRLLAEKFIQNQNASRERSRKSSTNEGSTRERGRSKKGSSRNGRSPGNVGNSRSRGRSRSRESSRSKRRERSRGRSRSRRSSSRNKYGRTESIQLNSGLDRCKSRESSAHLSTKNELCDRNYRRKGSRHSKSENNRQLDGATNIKRCSSQSSRSRKSCNGSTRKRYDTNSRKSSNISMDRRNMETNGNSNNIGQLNNAIDLYRKGHVRSHSSCGRHNSWRNSLEPQRGRDWTRVRPIHSEKRKQMVRANSLDNANIFRADSYDTMPRPKDIYMRRTRSAILQNRNLERPFFPSLADSLSDTRSMNLMNERNMKQERKAGNIKKMEKNASKFRRWINRRLKARVDSTMNEKLQDLTSNNYMPQPSWDALNYSSKTPYYGCIQERVYPNIHEEFSDNSLTEVSIAEQSWKSNMGETYPSNTSFNSQSVSVQSPKIKFALHEVGENVNKMIRTLSDLRDSLQHVDGVHEENSLEDSFDTVHSESDENESFSDSCRRSSKLCGKSQERRNRSVLKSSRSLGSNYGRSCSRNSFGSGASHLRRSVSEHSTIEEIMEKLPVNLEQKLQILGR